ncbi:hypothetical protein AgCh_030196 [Apium graveolens]
MPGVMESWTNELTKLGTWGSTVLSSGSSQADQAVRSEEAGSKSPTIVQFTRLHFPVKLHCSETAVAMMVDCFNP